MDSPNSCAPRAVKTSLPILDDATAPPDAVANMVVGGPLDERLAALAQPAVLWERTPDGDVRCTACAHRCVVRDGRAGACGVRFGRDGGLAAPFGYIARRYVRAVETNTVFHVKPGARALTFGTYGCDLRCPYCHNWRLSQALREGLDDEAPTPVTPEALVDEAVREGCEVVCAAYNEPMVAAEWARAVFSEAKARGLTTGLITDGHATPEALAYMRPVTDVYRVDLKGYSAAHYKALGARLGPVLDAIREAKRLGYWVEVVTLVVPGFNDDLGGLRKVAAWLASVDPGIPWHLNAFHPRYKLTALPRTDVMAIVSAVGMAYARGLKFVYASNLEDLGRELGHTHCPACHAVVVARENYETRAKDLVGGACGRCGEALPGLW